jgi:hypothetical protein
MSKQRAGPLLALGLLALTTVPAMASPDIKYVLQCGNAKSVPPDDDDPVLLTRIVAIADGETQNGEIYIRHFVASGENYTRNKPISRSKVLVRGEGRLLVRHLSQVSG